MIGFSSSNEVGSAKIRSSARSSTGQVSSGAMQLARFVGGVEHPRRVHDQHRPAPDVDTGRRNARADDHRFDPGVESGQHIVGPVHQFVEALDGKHVGGVGEGGRHPVDAEVEPGDHAEEPGACTASGPIQVAVLFGIGMHKFTVGGDDVDAEHVLACPTPVPRVPALPTLQQISAEADGRAMPTRKGQFVRPQERREVLAATQRWAHRRGEVVDVDRHLT